MLALFHRRHTGTRSFSNVTLSGVMRAQPRTFEGVKILLALLGAILRDEFAMLDHVGRSKTNFGAIMPTAVDISQPARRTRPNITPTENYRSTAQPSRNLLCATCATGSNPARIFQVAPHGVSCASYMHAELERNGASDRHRDRSGCRS